jgi:hypothetical protein
MDAGPDVRKQMLHARVRKKMLCSAGCVLRWGSALLCRSTWWVASSISVQCMLAGWVGGWHEEAAVNVQCCINHIYVDSTP